MLEHLEQERFYAYKRAYQGRRCQREGVAESSDTAFGSQQNFQLCFLKVGDTYIQGIALPFDSTASVLAHASQA
jgi:hypothetical protein